MFSSPHHYTVFMRGTRLSPRGLSRCWWIAAARLPTPRMPWYVTTLLVSQPLHFGDYGGMPMKIMWALLDVLTIVVLGSGLYLWVERGVYRRFEADESRWKRRRAHERLARADHHRVASVVGLLTRSSSTAGATCCRGRGSAFPVAQSIWFWKLRRSRASVRSECVNACVAAPTWR